MLNVIVSERADLSSNKELQASSFVKSIIFSKTIKSLTTVNASKISTNHKIETLGLRVVCLKCQNTLLDLHI